ncbi:hypothetical protein F2P56_033410 [Juglans regia]|uniref:Uncharacterized protein LOC109001620 n=2 Tax=Juglans regia TaxID=51240 RepID=A0A2I4FS85_JUGRE|nr:uncharacterized protein LOC109001620 [Juglans regia]KAF5447893.1 hypothetical protein F2P56_033410 [Juglans regia]
MVLIMKNIWHRRNKFVFEKKFLSPAQVVQLSIAGHEDYKEARRKGEGGPKAGGDDRRVLRRRRPEGRSLKANFDAALNETLYLTGVGIVIRHHNGELVAAKCANRRYSSSSFAAESMTLWEAMEMCKELGLWDVYFEGDAKEVIESVKREGENDSRHGQIIEAGVQSS